MTNGTTTGQRPTLLTVICILSFIAGAFGLWSGFQNAFTDAPQRELEEAKAQSQEMREQFGDSNPMMTAMMEDSIRIQENLVAHAKSIGYSGLVLNLIGVLGVWLMWNLKKNGFWIYLLSTVGGVVSGLLIMTGGWMANLSLGIGILISLVFVILYAVNLKHMR